ncbi:MAG: hypothetical protein JNM55_20200 [Anaerolineales bacterium]|nr:hypothetical protein [Anaerolineales bacterium]
MKLKNLFAERVNLRSTLIAMIIAMAGFLLMLWAANENFWTQHLGVQKLIETLGSTLIVTGLISVAWDLFGKRAFAEEILATISMSRALISAGILQIAPSFQSREINWDNLFEKASEVDVLFYGSSMWRTQNYKNIRELLQRSRTKLRILIPDPKDHKTMLESAGRFKMSVEDQVQYINKTINFFRELSSEFPKAKIQVWVMKKSPLVSIFRFDDVAVITFYSHLGYVESIPTIICSKGGEIYKFVLNELDGLCKAVNDTEQLDLKLHPDNTNNSRRKSYKKLK